MGVRFDRRAVIAVGKRDEAVEFAAKVTAYVSDKWLPLVWGLEVGRTNGAIHWFAEYDSMAQMEQILGETMTDAGYAELLDSAAGLFEPGTEDTLVYTM